MFVRTDAQLSLTGELLESAIRIIVAALIGLFVTSSSVRAQSSGTIGGAVFTNYFFEEAVVPDVKILFTSKSVRYETVSGPAGKYQIELPSGVYSVTTSRPGFCPFVRATFQVR